LEQLARCTLAHEMFEKTAGEYSTVGGNLIRSHGHQPGDTGLTIRTSKKTMTFRMPFVLGGFDDAMGAP
jgi:hypothetical protein